MLNFLSPYKYVIDAIVIAALVAGIAFGIHKYNANQQEIGASRVQASWDAEKSAQLAAQAKAAADALAVTKTLQTTIDTQRSQTNAQITALNNSLATAIAGLRERPARDSAGHVPRDTTTGTAIGATGANLLRQDGEFLARESARADKLRLQLIGCQSAYGAAREAVK